MSSPAQKSRDLVPRVLRELNTAMKVASFYPPMHPSVQAAVQRALGSLHSVLATSSELDLGFAEDGVLLQGDYLTESDPGLRGFSAYLLNRGVARLVFRPGLNTVTLAEFLRLLASDSAERSPGGGLARALASRGIHSIEVGEIDLQKILASEAAPGADRDAAPARDPDAWKRLVADFLRSPGGEPTDGLRTLMRQLGGDSGKLLDFCRHVAGETPRDLPRVLGRLVEEVHDSSPETVERLNGALGEVILHLEPRLRMDLMSSRLPLPDGTPNLLDEVTRRMTDPMIADLISSFVEAEKQLSPRLFSVCSKVFALRGKTAPYFGPVAACLEGREDGNDLKRIWQSLQGLLVESDQDYLSETYRATLEEISSRVEPVDAELRSALELAPGFADAFPPAAISLHAARVVMATLDSETDPALIDATREDLERRCRRLSGPGALPVLAEAVQALSRPLSGDLATPGKSAMDRRVRSVTSHMVQIYRSEFERLTDEDRAAGGRAFRDLGTLVAPLLVDALAEEESWEVRRGLLSVLSSLGRSAVPALLRRLDDRSWYLVRNLALLLGEIGGTALVEPLSGLLRHEEPRVRREAVTALGKIGGPRAVGGLRQALLDAEVGAVAARLLGEIDRDNTVAHFAKRLARAGPLLFDPAPIRDAISVLGEMAAAEAVPALSRILGRGFWIPFSAGDGIRVEAAQALHRIGTMEAKTAIQMGERSARRMVRDACRSLAEGSPGAPGPLPSPPGGVSP